MMGARLEGMKADLERLEKEVVQFHQKVTLSGLDTAVRTTRVDTGRARAGWHVSRSEGSSFGGYGAGGSAGSPPSGEQVLGADSAMSGLRAGESTFIIDNVNYISYLNDGTVHTAGDHMVEAALERMRREREGVF